MSASVLGVLTLDGLLSAPTLTGRFLIEQLRRYPNADVTSARSRRLGYATGRLRRAHCILRTWADSRRTASAASRPHRRSPSTEAGVICRLHRILL